MKNENALTRPLEISEIDFRVQSINNGGYATILAYKDARTDMSRLDEAFGPYGWQKHYTVINESLFCGVGILDERTNNWVWKWDVGTESMTEKEKGQASDAFKRACFNLGIGRELYEYPIINVKLNDDEWSKEGGKPKQTWNLKLKDWTWYSEFNDGKISFLAAKDQNGKVRFQWGKLAEKKVEVKQEPVVVKEEPNIKGILKTKHEEEDPDREAAIAEYRALFGKNPHGRMSTENIMKSISEKIEEDLSEEDDEIEFELPKKETSEKQEYLDKIKQFDDPEEFSNWARETLSILIESWDEDSVDEFKAICNSHYKSLV